MAPAPVCDRRAQSDSKRRINAPERQRKRDDKARPLRQRPPAKRMRESGAKRNPPKHSGRPKESQRTVASLRHKSYRNTAPPGTDGSQGAGTRTLRPPRNPTGRQRQGHTGANRAYRRNAPRRDTQTAGDRTRSDRKRTAEATRQKTQTQSTNEPPRPRAKPHQRAPGHAPDSAARRHPARQNQRQRRPTHRTRDRRKHASARNKAAKDNAHTTTQPHNAHNKRQRTEARGGNKQRRQATQTPPRHQKHQKHQHGEKPKNKSKKDGSWRQTVEREKVASPETTVRARSTRTKTEEAR